MQVEYVARVSLAARRTAQQQRYFAVSYRLLRQVIVNDERRAASVAEKFANGSACKRCKELDRRRIGSRSGNDGGISHRAVFFQRTRHVGYRRRFLAGSHVDAINRFAALVEFALVDDGVNGNSRFACLAVADDQLALTAANRNHGVNGLDARLQRLAYRLAEDNARSFALQRHFVARAFDFAFTVNRLAEGIYNAAYHAFAYRDGSDAAGAVYARSFADVVACTHQYHAHVVLFEVEYDGLNAGFKFNKLTRLCLVQAINAGNTVADLEHGSVFFELRGSTEAGKLLLQYR